MCAFFLPAMGELIMDGLGGIVGSTIATNMTNELINQFKPAVGRTIGKEISTYAKNHPKGIIANVLEGTGKTVNKTIENKTKNKINYDSRKERRYEDEMYEKYNVRTVPYRPKEKVYERVYNTRPARAHYYTNYSHSGHTKRGRRAAY